MAKKILLILSGLVAGLTIGYCIVFYTPLLPPKYSHISPLAILIPKKQVIGFLPYWLLSKAKSDYSPYVTTLTYFGLTIDRDGSIQKLLNPQEEEPGWAALHKGFASSFLSSAKKKGSILSLLVFSGDVDSINTLIENPHEHAGNLVRDIVPIMKKYGFTDLNLDIESVADASESKRNNMTEFVKTVRAGIDASHAGTLTIDVSPTDLIKKRLIDIQGVSPYVDYVVLMTYDYHYIGSFVTGAVAPVGGAGTIAEFDVNTGIQKALEILPEQKVILGIPLYGYEWETIASSPKSAVVPGTGLTISNMRAESFLSSCATCSAQWDPVSLEKYVVYKDEETGTYHQAFIPDKQALQEKIKLVQDLHLGGVALWALGYEGDTMLTPLKVYK